MSTTDYQRVFRLIPGLVLLLKPDARFTIVDASEAYLRATLTERDAVVGRGLFEVFPANPADTAADGAANLRASLERVIATRSADVMRLQKYDVPRPASMGGGFAERYWNPVNSPLLGPSGEVELILHQVEDATALRDVRASEILDTITEGFFGLDREWRYTFVNREAERILGLEPGELIGHRIWDVYPGLLGTDFEHAYRRSMDEGTPASVTSYYPDHDRWYEIHSYPAAAGISIYFRNVTEAKRTELERQRLAADSERQRRIYEVALSNTPDLVYIFGLDHRFIYANESLLAMWGVPREQALGKSCLELGYPAWEAEMHDREIDEVIATRAPIRGEVPFEGATGRRVWDYIFAPVFGPEGDVVAVAGTARDTTERRQSEEAIARHAEQLREDDRAKDEFIATLSHELRNPLAPLRSGLALLRMKPDDAASVARVHEMMERQVNHLVRLVGDLLDISRVTRGDFALRKEPLALGSVVRNAIETSQPVVERFRHSLVASIPEEPLRVEGDAVRLAQIVSNLIDNAAKYTPEGGRIEVVVGVEAGMAQVAVRDNGTGLSPQSRARIFEMFSRGDRAQLHGESGLGIGLALAKRLAEMHGGLLTASSAGPGQGSEFRLRLPLAAAGAVAEAAAAPQARALPSKRILVVDDNRDAADSLGMLLRELGADVKIARDGDEALAAFPAFEPSVVLLDIGMPGMDGYEVARRLRQRFPERRAALIALTGWGQQEDRARALEAGFDHHLVKPAEIRALQALLSSVPDAPRL